MAGRRSARGLQPTRTVRRPPGDIASSGIGDQVHEGLVEVLRVGLDGRAVARVLAPDIDALALDLVGVEVERAVEQLGELNRLKDEARRAGQLEKLLDDGVDALELMRDHALEALAEARIIELARHESRECPERRERVLDLVREPGGEGAQRGQPVGAPELLFEIAEHGDVAEDPDHAEVLAFAAAQRRRAHLDRQRAAVRAAGA